MPDVAGEGAPRSKFHERPLVIGRPVWEAMIRHCRDQLPNEACGLLSGRGGRASSIWPMKNTAASPFSFRMDDQQVKRVFEHIHTLGEQLAGIYHSHPTAPAVPSPLDILLAPYEDIPYIVVSLAGPAPEVGCYRIN